MKAFILLLINMCIFVYNASAQTPDLAITKATYEFIHIRDTANRTKPYKETMVLLSGRSASVYRSLTKQQQEEKMANEIANQVKGAADPNHLSLTITGGGVISNEEYYQYPATKKLYTEEKIINFYLTEEPLPVINWTIQNDTLSIGTLHCQKATAHFKGRDYEAWFCADLPFKNGPWKLNGLPGLIVQAADIKKEVIFNFMGFEDISQSKQTIQPPADDIKTQPKELARLKEARDKDPQGFMKSAHGNFNSSSRNTGLPLASIDPNKISSINIIKGDNSNSKTNNNPIELPEKK
ncbi:GLPGLI family protein [Mucilaginibacter sp. KACC 22773]|uniref:GLPGLI family protein n=1 Tax=Mucilaginibacter sp. KACC 22773 TaxID=3025671 RepID=UPI002365E5C6|nr:GLPGLI family protein [Mucilaginibacter sp. KACC 22773]WDF79816.1 GLPGLI family protein [Mucilaginibacter sp. KACC 22773]